MEQYECAFAGLVGYEGIKRELSVVLVAMNRQAEAEKLGAKGPQGLFLYGAPGNGKTAFARTFMAASGRPSFTLTPSEGCLEKLRSLIEKAAYAAPSCLLLNDFDKAADESDDWEMISSVQGLIDDSAPRGIYFIVTARATPIDGILRPERRPGMVAFFPAPRSGSEPSVTARTITTTSPSRPPKPWGELLLPVAHDVRRFLVANRTVLLKLTAKLCREHYVLRSQFEEFFKENPVDPGWPSDYR